MAVDHHSYSIQCAAPLLGLCGFLSQSLSPMPTLSGRPVGQRWCSLVSIAAKNATSPHYFLMCRAIPARKSPLVMLQVISQFTKKEEIRWQIIILLLVLGEGRRPSAEGIVLVQRTHKCLKGRKRTWHF